MYIYISLSLYIYIRIDMKKEKIARGQTTTIPSFHRFLALAAEKGVKDGRGRFGAACPQNIYVVSTFLQRHAKCQTFIIPSVAFIYQCRRFPLSLPHLRPFHPLPAAAAAAAIQRPRPCTASSCKPTPAPDRDTPPTHKVSFF